MEEEEERKREVKEEEERKREVKEEEERKREVKEEEERKREVKEEPQKPNKGKGKGKARKHKAKAKAQKFKRKVPQHVYGQQLWNQMDGFAMPPNMLPPSFPILPQASYTPMSVPPVPVKREDGQWQKE